MTDFPINRRQILKASASGILMSNLALDQAAAQQFEAPPLEATIEGTVTDQFGNPLSGIEVNITPESGVSLGDGTTNSDGEYFFLLRAFRTYTIHVDEDGYEEFTFTQPAGNREGYTIDIELSRVLPAQNGLAINNGVAYIVSARRGGEIQQVDFEIPEVLKQPLPDPESFIGDGTRSRNPRSVGVVRIDTDTGELFLDGPGNREITAIGGFLSADNLEPADSWGKRVDNETKLIGTNATFRGDRLYFDQGSFRGIALRAVAGIDLVIDGRTVAESVSTIRFHPSGGVIDENQRTVIGAFDAPGGSRASGLAYGDDSLWFADGIDSDLDGAILELNPGAGDIRSRIDTSYDPRGVAFGGGSLWVVNITTNDIVEYAPDGTKLRESDIQGPTGTTTPRGLAYFDGALWVGTNDGFLYKFSTDGALLETTGERDAPYGGLATTSTELLGPDEDGNLTVLRTLGESPPPGSPKGTIRGTVTDSEGDQLADVTLEFINESGTTVNSLTTDTNGSYETTLPADATYDVTVTKDGFQSETTQVTTIQSETKTLDLSLEKLPKLSIDDARLVQLVENTRIDKSTEVAIEIESEQPLSLESYSVRVSVPLSISSVVPVQFQDSFNITEGGEGSDLVVVEVEDPSEPLRLESNKPETLFVITLPVGSTEYFENIDGQVSVEELAVTTSAEESFRGVFRRGLSDTDGIVTDDLISRDPEVENLSDPPLIEGKNTTVVFDVDTPSSVSSLTQPVKVIVERQFSSGEVKKDTFKLRPDTVSNSDSILSQITTKSVGDVIKEDPDAYPVFKASPDLNAITVTVVPQEKTISGTTEQLPKGSDSSSGFEFSPTKDLNIGIIAVDDFNNYHSAYGEIGSDFTGDSSISPADLPRKDRTSAYRDQIRKNIKYAMKVLPTTQINVYRQDIDKGVQAGAQVPGIIKLPNSGVTEVGADMEAARTRLESEVKSGNIKTTGDGPPNGTILTIQEGEEELSPPESEISIDNFDVTIGIVPFRYLDVVKGEAPGSGTLGNHQTFVDSPRQPSHSAFVAAGASEYNAVYGNPPTTLVHEAAHHFIGSPFTGKIAREEDSIFDLFAPGTNPYHANDEVVSTIFDISDGGLDENSILKEIPSYMSYKNGFQWADSLTTRRLLQSNGVFEPTPPEFPRRAPITGTLFVAGDVSSSGIELRTIKRRESSISTQGPENGTEVRIKNRNGTVISSQRLPKKVITTTAVSGGGSETLNVADNVILGKVGLPSEAAEVEITAEDPTDSNQQVSKQIDTTGPLTADFFISSDPETGNPIRFDAGASFANDTDREIDSYEWDWTDDGTFETAKSVPTASHTYITEGEYTVTLRVTDEEGNTATTSEDVTVEPAESAVAVYANSDGVIDKNGLREATDDWVTQDIGIELLRAVIDAWREQRVVS